MTLAERLTTAAAQAVADAKYQGVGRTIAWRGPSHIDARYGRSVVVATLKVLDEVIGDLGEVRVTRENLQELIHEIEEDGP